MTNLTFADYLAGEVDAPEWLDTLAEIRELAEYVPHSYIVGSKSYNPERSKHEASDPT